MSELEQLTQAVTSGNRVETTRLVQQAIEGHPAQVVLDAMVRAMDEVGVYDDPAWFEEMVVTLTDLHVACLARVLQTGAQFDGASMWEDRRIATLEIPAVRDLAFSCQ